MTPIAPVFPAGTYGGAFADDPDAGRLWIIYTGYDAGVQIGGVVVLDDSTFATLQTIPSGPPVAGPSGFSQAGFVSVVAAPDLGQVFVANNGSLDGGSLAEIDAIDEQSYAVTRVALVQNAEDFFSWGVGLAYDPTLHRVYASVGSNGLGYGAYLEVADALGGGFILAYEIPDAGCLSSASNSCFDHWGQIAVDWSGQKIYALGGDEGYYPMAATFTLAGTDGGSLSNVLGGNSGGWYTYANGIAVLDGGAVVGIGLSDGGGILQFLDPYPAATQGTPTATSRYEDYNHGCGVVGAETLINGSTVFNGYGPDGVALAGWNPIYTYPADGCGSTAHNLVCRGVYHSWGYSTKCTVQMTPDQSLCPGAQSLLFEFEQLVGWPTC